MEALVVEVDLGLLEAGLLEALLLRLVGPSLLLGLVVPALLLVRLIVPALVWLVAPSLVAHFRRDRFFVKRYYEMGILINTINSRQTTHSGSIYLYHST